MTTTKRATYGFKLEFPDQFTLRQLRNMKGRKIKYITIYKRVEKALKLGEIVPIGTQEPLKARKGAHEIIYARVNAKTTVLPTTVPTLTAV